MANSAQGGSRLVRAIPSARHSCVELAPVQQDALADSGWSRGCPVAVQRSESVECWRTGAAGAACARPPLDTGSCSWARAWGRSGVGHAAASAKLHPPELNETQRLTAATSGPVPQRPGTLDDSTMSGPGRSLGRCRDRQETRRRTTQSRWSKEGSGRAGTCVDNERVEAGEWAEFGSPA
jgi:hypothetical protein